MALSGWSGHIILSGSLGCRCFRFCPFDLLNLSHFESGVVAHPVECKSCLDDQRASRYSSTQAPITWKELSVFRVADIRDYLYRPDSTSMPLL